MNDAFIIDGTRTAIGSFGGALSGVRPDDMAAHVIRKLMERYPGITPDAFDDVMLGCANQAGEDNRNVARMALLLAGLSSSVPGETVNRLCASGLCAVSNAARAIKCGEAALILAGGVESMTRAPYVLSKSNSAFARNAELFDTSIGWRFVNPRMREMYGTHSMGETAENVAERFGIGRADQDMFAVKSQQKAARARESGRLAHEITAIEVREGRQSRAFDQDEFIKPATTSEALAGLKPVFRSDGNGSVTAGNSSGINDGACVLLLGSGEALKNHSVKPLARVVTCAASGVEPRIMGMGPVEATRKALKLSGLKLDEMAVIELNEAFAAQSLACLRQLGLSDNDPRINPNGGAIALGHPLGMSGARLVLSATRELTIQKARYALCTMCVGVGQGVAMILERV